MLPSFELMERISLHEFNCKRAAYLTNSGLFYQFHFTLLVNLIASQGSVFKPWVLGDFALDTQNFRDVNFGVVFGEFNF